MVQHGSNYPPTQGENCCHSDRWSCLGFHGRSGGGSHKILQKVEKYEVKINSPNAMVFAQGLQGIRAHIAELIEAAQKLEDDFDRALKTFPKIMEKMAEENQGLLGADCES